MSSIQETRSAINSPSHYIKQTKQQQHQQIKKQQQQKQPAQHHSAVHGATQAFEQFGGSSMDRPKLTTSKTDIHAHAQVQNQGHAQAQAQAQAQAHAHAQAHAQAQNTAEISPRTRKLTHQNAVMRLAKPEATSDNQHRSSFRKAKKMLRGLVSKN